MKFLDRYLRDWRIKMSVLYVRANDKVLDIGCFDGSLFEKLKSKPIRKSLGIDPQLDSVIEKENYVLRRGKFPDDLPSGETFNCITMLAVLEHIPHENQLQLSEEFYNFLKSKGRIIITVPSPFVDHILWILFKFRLIDGMSLEEHYGFKIKEIPNLFDSNQFKLITHEKFQFGLNNLIVFEKVN